MADIMLATSTYQTGTNDTASTLVNNVTSTDATQPNGMASAIIQLETILGLGTDLKGTAADLVARLAVLLQASGNIKDKDGGTSYSKWDGWNGYGASTLIKRPNISPPGQIIMWSMTSIPSGWLELTGQQVSCTLYTDLLDNAISELDLQGTTIEWKRGTATFTVAQASDINTTTDTITKTAHGLSNGTVVHLSSSTTMPTGLATRTKYYLVGATTNTFQLSTTLGGSAVDITGLGSGTMSVYTNFQLPDWRGRSPIGAGTGSGLTARTINTPYGEETHALTSDENGTHSHTSGDIYFTNDPYSATPRFGPAAISGFANSATPWATTANSGSGTGHNTIHPVATVRYLVRY